ncbi:hypothetical protein LX32DRAFT_305349 [Colletotrichum zoysiae]|uniref:Uncharacterized protein n=1 Tax=Colletotrichum zoysiae TaxID=1216348 RepID=A0AAD9HV60_9PEZI|nr:hypothetical protein LX32DRAFT_305349 [Colletotrichum zoysiae]
MASSQVHYCLVLLHWTFPDRHTRSRTAARLRIQGWGGKGLGDEYCLGLFQPNADKQHSLRHAARNRCIRAARTVIARMPYEIPPSFMRLRPL